MSVFQYSKFQRVTVPEAMAGAKDVQGVIAEGHAELGAEPRYILQWPNAEKLGDNGIFVMVAGEVGQEALAKAQPPAMVTEEEARRRCGICFDDGHMMAMNEVAKEREARARKRNRPAKAKSKRNRH